MPFSNPILGGTALVRPAINSPDFQSGVTGWSINADGTAELNDAVIRGEVVVGPTGAGQVQITDIIPAELAAYYSDYSALSRALIKTTIAENGSYHYEIAGYTTGDFIAWNSGWVDDAGVVHEFTSQAYFPATGVAQATLGVTGDDSTLEIDAASHFVGAAQFSAFTGFSEAVNFTGDTSFNGVSLPRGFVLCEQITAGATAASMSEQLYYTTTATPTWVNDRAYRVTIVMQLSSAAAQTPEVRLRQTDLAGTSLLSGAFFSSGAKTQQALRTGVFINSSGADITAALAITVQPSLAAAVTVTSVAGAAQSYILVEDVGTAMDYAIGVSVVP